jgi:cell division septal protein FtsQ
MIAVSKSTAGPQAVSDEMGSLHFRRKEGRLQTKRIQRKLKLRFRHVLFSFIALAALFLAVQQVCLFALTWERMSIRDVTIICPNTEIKETIEKDLESLLLGNILLFDVESLKEKVVSHSRVKSVQIRKVLPPALVINVVERKPFAVLKAKKLYVIDNEGAVLYPLEASTDIWPLLVDEKNFESHFKEKIDSARLCLESLSIQDRNTIAKVDLTEHMNVKVLLKDSSTWLFLGADSYAEKIRRFQTSQIRLQKYGNLEYVDLRFDERFFIKISDSHLDGGASETEKEGD